MAEDLEELVGILRSALSDIQIAGVIAGGETTDKTLLQYHLDEAERKIRTVRKELVKAAGQ